MFVCVAGYHRGRGDTTDHRWCDVGPRPLLRAGLQLPQADGQPRRVLPRCTALPRLHGAQRHS